MVAREHGVLAAAVQFRLLRKFERVKGGCGSSSILGSPIAKNFGG